MQAFHKEILVKTKKPDPTKVRLFKKSELPGWPDNPHFGLLALADCGWSRLTAALLVTAGAKCKSSGSKCDNCCDFGDGHCIFRLLSMLVAR